MLQFTRRSHFGTPLASSRRQTASRLYSPRSNSNAEAPLAAAARARRLRGAAGPVAAAAGPPRRP